MKFLAPFIFLLTLLSFESKATHIAGGELFYEYQGPGASANTSRYKISMRLFRECNPPPNAAPLNGENVTIGIYSTVSLFLASPTSSLRLLEDFSTPQVIQNTPGINPCLTGNPVACYQIGIYSNTIDLANTTDGYTLSWIRYSRINLQNIQGSGTGATFTTQIPGTNDLPTGFNTSPQFKINDTAIVCKNIKFSLDFSALDANADSLAYKFSDAYDGAAGTSIALPNPAPPNNLQVIGMNYLSPYSGVEPLGSAVSINAKTGIISGFAPPVGKYVVCVIVEEWRNGRLINKHRKDFILNIADCSLSSASLKPNYINCDNFSFSFFNESPSPTVTSYLWKFGVPNSNTDTSTQPTPTYVYKDTGVYNLKLLVVANGGCKDSATAEVRVFPGFIADFSVTSSCILNPYVFKDLTVTKYGAVTNWQWDLGESNNNTDTFSIQNPSYVYPTIGSKTVTLIATNSKGCTNTIIKTIAVLDKPIIDLPFKDTLICSIDTLMLKANGVGVISWLPNTFISGANTFNPLVFPKDTITYYVTLKNNGCNNTDSIKVNVLDFITVDAGIDTTICRTDTFRLLPKSDALSYIWTTNTGVLITPEKRPLVQPLITTKYYVTANLGKCQDKDSLLVKSIPYPQVQASSDVAICFGNRTNLSASIVASSFTWTPTSTLINSNTLNPTAGPVRTTNYILTVTDTFGCSKPVSDTIVVRVVPIVKVNIGRDTVIVANQPLQLFGITNFDPLTINYKWTPTTGLNNAGVYNPIATLGITTDSIKYILRATTPEGCFGEDDIRVLVFKTEPDIFVPSAFSPNADGLNDIIKPIPVGISVLNFFSIYNRYGQIIFTTSEFGKGWNGIFNGTAQPNGTYVYQVQGTDYLGRSIFKKGTIVLLR